MINANILSVAANPDQFKYICFHIPNAPKLAYYFYPGWVWRNPLIANHEKDQNNRI